MCLYILAIILETCQLFFFCLNYVTTHNFLIIMIILTALFNQAVPISLNGKRNFSNILKHKLHVSDHVSNAANRKVYRTDRVFSKSTLETYKTVLTNLIPITVLKRKCKRKWIIVHLLLFFKFYFLFYNEGVIVKSRKHSFGISIYKYVELCHWV